MVRWLAILLVPLCSIAGSSVAAESPFIGTWTLDASKTSIPDEMNVQNVGDSKYSFDFGGGVETIVVDGTFQQGYGDTRLSVKAETPTTWIVERKQDEHVILKATWKLAKDGKTLTDQFQQFDNDRLSLGVDYVYEKTGTGSGFAGDWRSIKENVTSSVSMQVTPFEGDGLSFVVPSFNINRHAKLDGKDHPKEGSEPSQSVSSSARLIDDRNLMISDKVGDRVSVIDEISLSKDLRTLTLTVRIPGHDKPIVMVFAREKHH